MAKEFHSIGNLAFYDGWNPDYVYFSSLLNAGIAYENSNWDVNSASQVATQAITDAKTNINFHGMSAEDSTTYFIVKFNDLCIFLHKAMLTERAAEREYFNKKLQEIKSNFTPEEIKIIAPLTKIIKVLENGTKSFVYSNFITLINVIMNGIDNAKLLATHEKKRIEEIQQILNNLATSRGNQARGLKKKANQNEFEQEIAAQKAIERLNKKIEVEYIEHGTLTRKENNHYALFGGKQFQDKVTQPINEIIATWAKDVLQEIIANPQIISNIVNKLQQQNPILNDGNFSHLTSQIRQIIITGIIQYGMNNLNTVLNKEINEIVVKEIENTLTKTNNIFDIESQYKVHGISKDFTSAIYNSTIFNGAKTTVDLVAPQAEKVFEQVRTLLAKEKELKHEPHVSYLIQAMNSNYANANHTKTTLQETEEILQLITEIEKIRNQAENLIDKWEKNSKQDLKKDFFLNKDKSIPITVTIHNGQVSINMEQLTQAIQNNPGYKNLGFKTFNPTSIKNLIITLKRRASKELKNKMISATQNAINKNLFNLTETELLSIMHKELSNLQINIDSPTVEQLTAGLQFSQNGHNGITVSLRPGKKQVITIELKYNEVLGSIKTNLIRQHKTKVVNTITDLQAQVIEAQENFALQFQEQFNSKINELEKISDIEAPAQLLKQAKVNMSRLRKYNDALADAQEQIRKVQYKLTAVLKKEGIDEDRWDDVKKYAFNTLKNSIKISKAVTSTDTYMNETGFSSDILGTNLDNQLNSLNKIFTAAGKPIEQKDMAWLRSAILNCFPKSIAGEHNKNLIENYLGALAAFALFEDGSAEAAMLSGVYDKVFQGMQNSMTTPEILHLYVVDGIYVPGSYVLQKTLNSIEQEVLPNIEKIPTIMKRGAGVSIINKISENCIPNRPIYQHINNPNSNAWEITGANAAKQVQIRILFLAGLLDIVNAINKRLAKVEIPD